ncbi:MAG: hypothetical protein UW32_C0001G0066 [Candidatus Wolfebacteria bacterium GW2011_GWE2_44_13]|uniref:Band 7 domain-containing protein n=1 Tax=Candidatus Wolfebacteria bacterium GW2011_GWE2_44_13 TaxID=1619017 RepID=A0A0G1K6I7_9BACT|nr:MAG: hypothetical protein UW32_C0001G0066 [Candidatus Wolfebacteria bacterium GW2011_GWE2_44_13]
MALILWFVFLIVVGVACINLYPSACDSGKIGNFWKRRHAKVVAIGKSALWTLWGIAVLSPVYYEFPAHNSVVVTFDRDHVVEHRLGKFCWEWGEFSNLPTGDMAISSGVTFLTENPKVRHLRYSLNAGISNPEAFYSVPLRRINASDVDSEHGADAASFTYSPGRSVKEEVEALVITQLFEFNNRFSKQLVGFYNPLDSKQQQDFRALIEPWLNDQLAKDGVTVVAKNFKID